jgi:aspartyl-tRNA(Asn)/glutamyl-tRNA(Gln) amidotransferase subunit A
MLDAITRYDPRDALATGDANPSYCRRLDALVKDMQGMTIAWSKTLGPGHAAPAIVAAMERAVQRLQAHGAIVEEITLSERDPRPAFSLIFEASLAASIKTFNDDALALIDPGLLRNALRGRTYSAEDLLIALGERETWGRQMNLLHERYDLLITPQLAVTAFACGYDMPPNLGMTEWLDWSPFTYVFNLTQQPAASVPCGHDEEGMPIALQIVGPRHADLRVLQCARVFEALGAFPVPSTHALDQMHGLGHA